MTEKELNKLFDNLKEIIKKVDDNSIDEKFNQKVNEALNEPCKILIEKKEDETSLSIHGGTLTILLTLAGAERGILEQLDCSEDEFNFIKSIVGIKNSRKDMEV